MRAYIFHQLLHKRMAEKGMGGKEITVHIPGMGAAAIEDIRWHPSCDEFHVMLKTVDTSKN